MSKPTQAIFVLWAISVAVLFLGKQGLDAWQGFGTNLIILALVLGTNALLRSGDRDTAIPRAQESRLLVWAQLAIIVVAIGLTGLYGSRWHGLAVGPEIPLWGQLLQWTNRVGIVLGIGGNQATNLITYALIPGAIVLVLRARLSEIGFAWFGNGCQTSMPVMVNRVSTP